MKNDVIDRLNALMQKRSSSGRAPEPPTLTTIAPDSPEDDDDGEAHIPVLTNEVDFITMDEGVPFPHSPEEQDEVAVETPSPEVLAAEFANLLQQRLATELPPLLEATFLRLSAELYQSVGDITQAAVNDFLATHARSGTGDRGTASSDQ